MYLINARLTFSQQIGICITTKHCISQSISPISTNSLRNLYVMQSVPPDLFIFVQLGMVDLTDLPQLCTVV